MVEHRQTAPHRPSALAEVRHGRLDFLDGIRALAALEVLMGHVVWQVWPNWAPARGVARGVLMPFHFAHSAVGVFIILSGFCLMLPVVRSDGVLTGGAGRFFLRRCRRILPPFYAAALLSILLGKTILRYKMGRIWDQCLMTTPDGILSNFLLLHNLWPHSEINYVFWSIAVEWQIYFLFPLLVVAFRSTSPAWVVAGLFMVSAGLFFVGRNTLLAGLAPQYLALFGMGMLAAKISYDPKWSKARSQVPWLATAAGFAVPFVLVLRYWQTRMTGSPVYWSDLLLGLSAASLLIAISQSEHGVLRRLLSLRPLVIVGTFSYSLYLIHAPLLQLIWQYLLRPAQLSDLSTYLLLLFAGVPCIVAAAFLFFWVFERPFLSSRRTPSVERLAKEAVISPAP